MKTVILTTCETAVEAHLIKHKLEIEQIDCFIANENFATMMPHLYRMLGNGVQVVVNESDWERASQLISYRTINEQVTCPNCNSFNIAFGLSKKRWLWVAISLLFGTPFNNLNNRFYCKECGTEFKKNLS